LREQIQERALLFTADKIDEQAIADSSKELVTNLAKLSIKYPNQPVYHVLLARMYADEGQFDKAIPYYLRATTLLPEDGLILAEYAQILFLAEGNSMTAQIKDLALRSLQLTPQNQTGLSLAGIASFQDGEFQRAIDFWTHALALLPAGSPSGEALRTGIESARERLGSMPGQDQAAPSISLKLNVALGEGVDVPPDTTVFVYARTWQGSPMPLAISRLKVSDLPLQVELTEAMAMSPAMSLATVEQVEVVARVSISGSPTAAAGDYQAALGPVAVREQQDPIDLAITTMIAE